MAAVDPEIRTVLLTRIPRWVRQNPDTEFVVGGISRSIEMTIAPTVAISYPPHGFDDIRVEFLSHDSAREAMRFYNAKENKSEGFTLGWSAYNIKPSGNSHPNPTRCPVRYRFPERDIQAVARPNEHIPPEPVHPMDPYWFCRYNPYQREIGRQVHYMWSPPVPPPQTFMWVPPPQAYMWVPQPHHQGPLSALHPQQMGPPRAPRPHQQGLQPLPQQQGLQPAPQNPNWQQHQQGHQPVLQQQPQLQQQGLQPAPQNPNWQQHQQGHQPVMQHWQQHQQGHQPVLQQQPQLQQQGLQSAPQNPNWQQHQQGHQPVLQQFRQLHQQGLQQAPQNPNLQLPPPWQQHHQGHRPVLQQPQQLHQQHHYATHPLQQHHQAPVLYQRPQGP